MKTRPKLGQNFLTDARAAGRIVSALGDLGNRTVIEIGPGRGAITNALALRAGHVLAIELDRTLAARLREKFPADRVTIVEQDVLDFDFMAAAQRPAPGLGPAERLPVVGNLPYYITSPILLKLATSHAALDLAVLMVQREVADRVAAVPGSRDYGPLSVTVQMYGPVERLLTLSPSAFSPPPEVHSTVFRWKFAPRFAQLNVEESAFLGFVRTAFAQKRKTLANNLRAAGISPAVISGALTAGDVPANARTESLSIDTLAEIWRFLYAEKVAIGSPATPPKSVQANF